MLRCNPCDPHAMAPKMIPWHCTHNSCQNCGVRNKYKQFIHCSALLNSSLRVAAKEWVYAPQSGTDAKGKQNTQIELADVELSVGDLVQKLEHQLEICRTHEAEAEWINRCRLTDIKTVEPGTAVVLTDFSATVDLRAAQTDNSSVDNHAVLDIFMVLHSARTVPIIVSDTGETEDVWTCTVECFYFFGPSMSKGKKNNHVFHNACLDQVQRYLAPIQVAVIWSDNCASQYKCKHNFHSLATYGERHDCNPPKHRFAMKFHFKGPHDAAGKVAKDKIRELELTRTSEHGTRCATALDRFYQLRKVLPKMKVNWDSLAQAQSREFLKKGKYGIDNRHVGYATDNFGEYTMLRDAGYDLVAFTDRTKLPNLDSVSGSNSFHEVIGSKDSMYSKEKEIMAATMPCSCVCCRGKVVGPCQYHHIRQTSRSKIREKEELSEQEQQEQKRVRAEELSRMEAL